MNRMNSIKVQGYRPFRDFTASFSNLYPYHKAFRHETVPELQAIIMAEFKAALRAKGIADDERYLRRFKIFCFKHDLEALVLAAEEGLALWLQTDQIKITWRIPVEDQNNDTPPKRVVEALFAEHGQRYQATVDTPRILGMADYHAIAEACPQSFKPFVEFLESIKG